MTSSPVICGYFSITEDGEYEDSVSSLRYFRPPRLPLNLNKGIEDFKEDTSLFSEKKLNWILRFLVNHKREYLNKASFVKDGDILIPSVQIITSRGVLRMIFCSSVDSWCIIATRYKGNIYLCKYHKDEEIEIQNRDTVYKTFSNYGQMFRHHCLSEHPTKRPDTSQACNGNTTFHCVFKRNLVNRQFLFAAEAEAVNSEAALDEKNSTMWKPNKFVKLKLNIELTTRNRKCTFETKKVHNLWAQCYLSGIEQVYMGFRDNDGIVWQRHRYSIDELEEISKQNGTSSKSALELLNHFLDSFENDLMVTDCPYTTIMYEYDKDFERLSSMRYEGRSQYTFLPDWYIKEMTFGITDN